MDINNAQRFRERMQAGETLIGMGVTFADPSICELIAEAGYDFTWIDMEHFNDPAFAEEKDRRCELMLPYQVNAELLAGSRAKVMHDMPMHLGYEITGDVAEGERSVIYDQAENRLDAQKAVLLTLA